MKAGWPLTRKHRQWLALCTMWLLGWWLLGLTPKPLLVNPTNGSYAVTDRQGQLLRLSLTSDEKYRLWTPLKDMPPALMEATLHYEDRWFYYHPGVNPFALARVLWHGLFLQQRKMGASTLTMQLARQRWRLKTNRLSGKLQQMAYALWLERHYSKTELLQAYLNLAPYGANIEGVGAAAWIYFHKPASALNLDEARALALLPQNPRWRAPGHQNAKQTLRNAWRLAYGDDPGIDRISFWQRQDLPIRAPHLAERLHERYPRQANLASTIDKTAQALAEELLANFLRQHHQQGINNATVMVVDTTNMEVLAYVGSADYFNRHINGFVNGLKAPRSPGSALKPFIYAQAIAQGLITPDTRLKDTPLRFGDYQPENFERNFYGPLSATDALVRSRNIPAISLMAQLKNPTFTQFLQQAGVPLAKRPADYGLGLAIGGAEITMEDLLRLYALLANNGQHRQLHWLTTLPPEPSSPLLMPQAAYLTRLMLQANPRPQHSFGTRHYGYNRPVAWKTGTSSGLRDAWAIGLMDNLLVGIWVGNFNGAANPQLLGRDLAGPLLFDILDAIALERPTPHNAEPPSGLKRIDICPQSGLPASAWCPKGKTGWTIPGVSPIKTCTIHRQIRINPDTGLQLCPSDNRPGRTQVAEFWDSDEQELFGQAGLQHHSPPAFEQACQLEVTENGPNGAPKITAPHSTVSYPLRQGQANMIEFSAIASRGGQRLFWFVDDDYVGEGITVFWHGKPGRFAVVVVDDQGRSASSELVVSTAEQTNH